MANIYKDSDKRKKVVPGGAGKPQDAPETPEVVPTPAKPEPAQVAPSEPVAEPVIEPLAEEKAPAPVADILADLLPDKKPTRDTYGFYLDKDVHDELVRLTKQTKAKNKSVFLNALLRRVLFNE